MINRFCFTHGNFMGKTIQIFFANKTHIRQDKERRMKIFDTRKQTNLKTI